MGIERRHCDLHLDQTGQSWKTVPIPGTSPISTFFEIKKKNVYKSMTALAKTHLGTRVLF